VNGEVASSSEWWTSAAREFLLPLVPTGHVLLRLRLDDDRPRFKLRAHPPPLLPHLDTFIDWLLLPPTSSKQPSGN
jgi:hypothetical protein